MKNRPIRMLYHLLSLLMIMPLLFACENGDEPASEGNSHNEAAPSDTDTPSGEDMPTFPDTDPPLPSDTEKTDVTEPDTDGHDPVESDATQTDPAEPETEVYDRECFNGVGYVPFYFPAGTDIGQMAGYVGDLGAVNVRLWAPFGELLEAPDRINRKNADYLHDVIATLRENGVKRIIAMNHDWYVPDKNGNPIPAGCTVPQRDTEAYRIFLDWYETSWETVAREFPDVDGFETGNEANHIPFMHASEGEEFDLLQRADICTDMMFRSCRAIRGVSEEKIVVMPGMAPIGGQRIGVYADNIAVEYDGMVQTLERIYTNIESGAFGSTDPRDFFDKLCWHPYYAKQNERGEWSLLCPDKEWVAVNKAVYAVAEAHGDGNVGCYFSEYGYNDGNSKDSDRVLAKYIVTGLKLTQKELPFVETVQVYRLFNFMLPDTVWDDYSLCDARTDPPQKKEKFTRLKKYYAENSVDKTDGN